jgi:hypothetical protein
MPTPVGVQRKAVQKPGIPIKTLEITQTLPRQNKRAFIGLAPIIMFFGAE